MSSCLNKILCRYFAKKTPTIDNNYQNNVQIYCNGEPKNCAIYMIFDKLGFVKVPVDLRPEQTAKAKSLIGN